METRYTNSLLQVGDQVPDFPFSIEKQKVDSFKNYRGKVVLINFFATWCSHCRVELPRVQKEIWERYSNENLAVLSFARDERWGVVNGFKRHYGFTFPIVPDELRRVYNLFATQLIPRNVLVNASGAIIYQSSGYTVEEFDNMISIIESELK
ncbi:redoxin domain-containing protein [Pedobacter sp. HMF7647]|uniref:Redoxin domain-containing protein n=1 Tax=Hufsiella arboris TaxID=2695275 RepID=A0A7K1YEM7_9SPHI|nr:TlpA disulfide reductase family protein [Hufsiella arboris]MXV53067.1 redoxin domain-containing protein [Hufsiella arboris]